MPYTKDIYAHASVHVRVCATAEDSTRVYNSNNISDVLRALSDSGSSAYSISK